MKIFAIVAEVNNTRFPVCITRSLDQLRFAYPDIQKDMVKINGKAVAVIKDIKPKDIFKCSDFSGDGDDWDTYNIDFTNNTEEIE